MGRGKLALELITKEKPRNITFQKRKKGLLKKAYEFSTLCGVNTCIIIYGPDQNGRHAPPETWPPNPSEVRRVINLYKEKDVQERMKKTVGVTEFFLGRKKRIAAEIAKLQKENQEAKYPTWDDRIDTLSEDQMRILVNAFDAKLEDVKRRIMMIKGEHYLMDQVAAASGFIAGPSTQSCNYSQGLIFPKNEEFGILDHNQQQLLQQPLDHHIQVGNYNPSDHDQEHGFTKMMMMMNDDDYTPFGGVPVKNTVYYDPMLSVMQENVMLNNFVGGQSIMWNSAPTMQGVQPYGQSPMMSRMHATTNVGSFSNELFFNDFNAFELNKRP